MGSGGEGGKKGESEVRVRLRPETVRRLRVLAAVRGQTPSEVVAWALLPHLAFETPKVPDVRVEPMGGAEKGVEGRELGPRLFPASSAGQAQSRGGEGRGQQSA